MINACKAVSRSIVSNTTRAVKPRDLALHTHFDLILI